MGCYKNCSHEYIIVYFLVIGENWDNIEKQLLFIDLSSHDKKVI